MTKIDLKLDDVLVIGPGQPDNARLAALARQWRKDSGLTQEQVARQMGMTSGYVRMIEKGDRSPSAEALVDLLRVFAVRHLTDYQVGDRVWDLVIAAIDEGRQTKYGVEFKGRMRSNRRAPVVDRGDARFELLRRSFGSGDPLDDAERQRLEERVAAQWSQLHRVIHLDADISTDKTISQEEADADLAKLTRFLGSADPQIVRRLIEMLDEETGITLG